jgi:hypothetical protein
MLYFRIFSLCTLGSLAYSGIRRNVEALAPYIDPECIPGGTFPRDVVLYTGGCIVVMQVVVVGLQQDLTIS